MIKIASRQIVPIKAPDVASVADASIASLAEQTSLAMQMIQLLAQRPEREPQPIRLEADILRDKSGKMTKIVITPIR